MKTVPHITVILLAVFCLQQNLDAQQRRVVRTPGQAMGPSYKKMTFGKESAEIPITIASTQILVDNIYVNGKGPFRFVLDTGGMGGGRVDSSLAKKLDLQPSGEVTGGDGTNRPGRQMKMYELDRIEFGGLKFEGVRVLSRDYNQHGASVRGHIDGILGFALFKELLLTIDYSKRKLTVETGSLPAADGKTVLSTDHNGVPGVEFSLAGKKHSAFLDTGAMGWISVSDKVAENLEFIGDPVQIGEARTLTGSFPIKRGQLQGEVKLGSHSIKNPFIVIGAPLRHINFGGFILRDFVTTYDQKNKRVKIVKADSVRSENAPVFSRLGREPIRVPMKVESGHPTIEAMINGKGPFKFVFDTGAGTTILDPDLFDELGVKPTGTTKFGDPSDPNAMDANTYVIDSIKIGDATFETLNAIGWKGISRANVRGIIGLPTFEEALLTMDYPNEELIISRGALGPEKSNVDYRIDMGFAVTIDVKLGNETVATHIDSGNMGFFAVPKSLAEKLTLKSKPKLIGRARTASGEFEVYGAQFDGTINVMGQSIKDPNLHFNDRFNWGNIGSRLLADYALTIDQTNRRLRLVKPEKKQANAKPKRPRLGIALGLGSDGSMTIQEVIAGGLAEKHGLKSGDQIIKANGKAVADLSTDDRNKAFRSLPLKLTINRDGKELEIEIKVK